MYLTTLITTILMMLFGNTIAHSSIAVVSLNLSTSSDCAVSPQTFDMETNHCYSLGDTKGMRVISHSPGLKYDALRVFKTGNCDAGQEWKYVALDGGACEDAGMYKAFLVTLRD